MNLPLHRYLNASVLQQLKMIKSTYPNYGKESDPNSQYDYITASRDGSGFSFGMYVNGSAPQYKNDLTVQRSHAQALFEALDLFESVNGEVSLDLIPDMVNGPF